MTVAELIAELQKFPPEAPVILTHEVYPSLLEEVKGLDPTKFLFPPVEDHVSFAVYLT